MTIDQFFIAIFGVSAIWLANDNRTRVRRWGCIFGLIGQPFWMWSAWSAQQWGILALTFFYTAAWIKGVRVHWFNSQPDEEEEGKHGK